MDPSEVVVLSVVRMLVVSVCTDAVVPLDVVVPVAVLEGTGCCVVTFVVVAGAVVVVITDIVDISKVKFPNNSRMSIIIYFSKFCTFI